ncbi:MAG: hypothetical protein FWG98_04050 [Candidatus Cloacimonetes bacterium]|nr:hypothetical protein [Candidatus Cloacimonadota bacterium]
MLNNKKENFILPHFANRGWGRCSFNILKSSLDSEKISQHTSPPPFSNNEEDLQPLFTWTSFPFIDFPQRSILVCLTIIIMAYLLWQLAVITWDQPLFYVIGLLILFGSLMPYFVPTTYFFYEDRFLVQYPIFKIDKPYKDYGCFYTDKMGIMLSTFVKPRRLDSFRGQSIRFSKSKNEKEQLIIFLKEKIGKQY